MQATAKPKVLPQRPAQRLIIVRSLHACCGLVRAGWIGPEKVFGAEVSRNGAPCSISRRHLKGCVKVCSTWALVDGLILGRPGTIVVVSS